MKKILYIILVVAMFVSCFISKNIEKVKASSYNQIIIDNVDWSDVGYSNVKIKYRSDIELNSMYSMSNLPSIEIDYIIDSTGDIVHFERIGNIGYHYFNNELLITTVFDVQAMSRATVDNSLKVIDEYPNATAKENGFSLFYYVKQTSWKIEKIAELFALGTAKDRIVSVIQDAIRAAALATMNPIVIISTHITITANNMYSYVSTIADVGQILANGDLNGVNLMYQSFNNACGILAWYGFSSYLVQDNKIVGDKPVENFMKNSKHTWDGHPYDYNQPSACRVLVNSYQ